MRSRGDLAAELKRLVEALHPDLRPFLRPSLLGKVVAVDDDNYRVDVVVGGDEETGEEGLALPDVPVASLFAQDGYGIWALPEVDAEVTVSFHDGDVTQPYVESPIFHSNKAPTGFESGTIAVVGKQGQKVVLKPDDNEIAISCETLSIVRDSKGVEQTKGDFEHTIDGKRSIAVKQDDTTTVDGKSETAVKGSLSLSTDQNGEIKAQINLVLSATAIATLSGAQVKLGGDGASDFLVKGTTFLSALIGLLSSGTDSFGKPIFPAAAAVLQPGSMLSNKVSVQ